jgi:hypothetical protein
MSIRLKFVVRLGCSAADAAQAVQIVAALLALLSAIRH